MSDGKSNDEIRCGACDFLMGYGACGSVHDYRCRYCQWEWDYFIERILCVEPPELPCSVKETEAWGNSRNLRTGMFYSAQRRENRRMEAENFINNLAYELGIGDAK